MKRRQILSGGLGLVGVPSLLHAQVPRAPGKTAYIQALANIVNSPNVAILRPVWQRLGYVEGETMLLRSAEGDPRRCAHLRARVGAALHQR